MGIRDCGLFAIVYALEACLENTSDYVNFKQNKMHHHLHIYLEGTLTQFPKLTEVNSALHWCFIYVEWQSFLIQYDLCKQWYKCVNIELIKFVHIIMKRLSHLPVWSLLKVLFVEVRK